MTLDFERVLLRIGKQQLPWGAGYSWNPTDIFNAKDPLDSTYERVGLNAFQLQVPFGTEGMVTVLIRIGEAWRTTTKVLKVEGHIHGFDFSGSSVEKTQKGIEYASSPTTTERRRLFGGDFSGEMFGLGIRGEGAVNRMEMSEDFGQYLVGADHTFESGLYFIGEYYRNGLGKADPGRYDLDDWIRFLSTEGENLGQDYLFLGERYTIAELLVWSNHVLINLNDKSGTLFPWLDYSLDDNAEVTLVGYIPFGAFGVGGFVRLRAYF